MTGRGRGGAGGDAALTPRAPRHLVRRALAFAVDHTLAVLVVLLATLPFTDQGLRLPRPLLPLTQQDCTPLDTAPAWLRLAEGEGVAVLRLCEGWLYGLPDGREVVAVIEGPPRADGSRPARFLREAVRADLSRAPSLPGLPALLVLGLMGSLGALLARAGQPSPGKALMGLRIEGPPRRALLREALRLGPLALPPLVTLLAGLGLIAPPLLWEFATAVTVAALGAAVGLWYYLWPLRRGGAPRHDALTGYRVLRR